VGILAKTLGLETLADVPLGDYSADVQPPSRSSAPATVDRALSLPAVFRAVQLIAGMAAQLEVGVMRRGTWIDPPTLVTQPDPWRPLDSWIERIVVGMATDGNAFLRKHRGSTDQVVQLEVLDPFKVYVDRDKNKRKVYLYGSETLKADDVQHLWGLEVPGLNRGLGPIGHCRASLSGALDIRDYASDWFRSDDVPSGVLSTDQRLDGPAVAEYKRRWLNLPELDANGQPIDGTGKTRLGPNVRVLGQGLKYTPIMLKPEEAQWLEAQRFGVLDVARIFGLPADYLLAAVEGTSLTYANLEMIDAQFLRTTLFPAYLRKIEGALSAILPHGQRARFRTADLLRPDAKTRAEIDSIYLDKKVITPAEVRRREGMD
jgi:HK97 family phage portal protein